jgi:2Fe-2S ferredoxin
MSAPQQPYTITFLPAGSSLRVDPAKVPYTRHGKPGSILEIALGNDVEIDHACGGVAACSTCHVVVKSGLESIPAADEQEEDMLDTAPGVTPRSRLACQAVPDGRCDLVVEIPSWNRNHAKEGHH